MPKPAVSNPLYVILNTDYSVGDEYGEQIENAEALAYQKTPEAARQMLEKIIKQRYRHTLTDSERQNLQRYQSVTIPIKRPDFANQVSTQFTIVAISDNLN